jgi:small-conductance mechanosensitive channel
LTLDRLVDWVDLRLFSLGGVQVTTLLLLQLAAMAVLLIWVASFAQRWVAERALSRFDHLDAGTRQAFGTLLRYLILVVGFAMILQNAGINLAALGVVAGAIGVGVGFGLQNIISNFISGLIIMLERPIRAGDRIEVAGVEGVVHDIGARRTLIVTHDNVSILIPNQRFITENIVNLVYAHEPIRLRVPLQVAAGADLNQVMRWVLDAAAQEPGVLKEPAPSVLVLSLGGATMQLEVAVWHEAEGPVRQDLTTRLNLRLAQALREHEVRTA